MSSPTAAGRTHSPSLLDITNRHTYKPSFTHDTHDTYDDDSAIGVHYSPDRLSSTVASILTSTPLVKTHLRTVPPPPPLEPLSPYRGGNRGGLIGEEEEGGSFDSSPIPQTLHLRQHAHTTAAAATTLTATTTSTATFTNTARGGEGDDGRGERILVPKGRLRETNNDTSSYIPYNPNTNTSNNSNNKVENKERVDDDNDDGDEMLLNMAPRVIHS